MKTLCLCLDGDLPSKKKMIGPFVIGMWIYKKDYFVSHIIKIKIYGIRDKNLYYKENLF